MYSIAVRAISFGQRSTTKTATASSTATHAFVGSSSSSSGSSSMSIESCGAGVGEGGVEVDEVGFAVTESLGVVTLHLHLAAGLLVGTEEPVGTTLVDQGEFDGAGDDSPRVLGNAYCPGAHGLEGGDCSLHRLVVVLAGQRAVLLHRVGHEIGGFGVVAPAA